MSLDPKLGKLSVPQTLNRYVYCINNPLRYVDPTGMDFWNDLVDQATGYWIVKWISSTADWYSHASDAERAGFWSGIAAGIVAGVAIGLAPFSGGASLLLLATIPAITGAAVYTGVTLACGGQPTLQGMMTTAGWAGFAGGMAGGAAYGAKMRPVTPNLVGEGGSMPIKGRTVVIGEDMNRVRPFAKQYGYECFETKSPPSQWMSENRAWFRARLGEGYTIVDLGTSPTKPNYPYISSPYYRMEIEELAKQAFSNWLPIYGAF